MLLQELQEGYGKLQQVMLNLQQPHERRLSLLLLKTLLGENNNNN